MSLFPKKIVGIDFHDYSAQLVEIKRDGNAVSLEAFSRKVLPPNVIQNGEIVREDELKVALKELLDSANPRAIEAKSVAIIFPSSKVLTHIFEFPGSLNAGEIKKALPFEAEKIIPFSIDDVYWDFNILQNVKTKEGRGVQYVLFASIARKIADKYADVLESIGLNPFLFGIQAETLRCSIPDNLLSEKSSLIIDIGTLSVNYLIVKDKIIRRFFSTNDGGYKLITEVARELQVPENVLLDKKEKNKLVGIPKIGAFRTFLENSYKKAQKIILEHEGDKAIGKIENIFITGEFLNLPDFLSLAKVYFPNQNIKVWDAEMLLKVNHEQFAPLASKGETANPYSVYFSNAIGVALRGLRYDIGYAVNLLPDRLKESFANKKTSIFLAVSTIFITAVSLFIATFTFFEYQSLYYDRLNLEIEKSAIEKVLYGTRYQEIREQIVSFNTEVNSLANIDGKLFSLPSTIEDFQSLLPVGIELSSLKYRDEDLSFEISGIADTRENLLSFKNSLEGAEFVEEVIAPRSNFDEKANISFLMKIKLDFTNLKHNDPNSDTR